MARWLGLAGLTPFTFQFGLPQLGRRRTPFASQTFDVFTSDITAFAGVNYLPIVAGVNNPPYSLGTVTFAPGQVLQNVTVWVIAGTIPVAAGVKAFAISLSDPAHPGVALATDRGGIIPQDQVGSTPTNPPPTPISTLPSGTIATNVPTFT